MVIEHPPKVYNSMLQGMLGGDVRIPRPEPLIKYYICNSQISVQSIYCMHYVFGSIFLKLYLFILFDLHMGAKHRIKYSMIKMVYRIIW